MNKTGGGAECQLRTKRSNSLVMHTVGRQQSGQAYLRQVSIWVSA